MLAIKKAPIWVLATIKRATGIQSFLIKSYILLNGCNTYVAAPQE